MGDLSSARVMAQLELCQRLLHDQELQLRTQAQVEDRPVAELTATQYQDLRYAQEFRMGEINGLVTAQLVLSERRAAYARRYSMESVAQERARIRQAELDAELPVKQDLTGD